MRDGFFRAHPSPNTSFRSYDLLRKKFRFFRLLSNAFRNGSHRRNGSLGGSGRKEIHRLKQLLAEKTLEVDFFKGALQKIEARRQRNSGSGEMASTTRSEK